MAKVIQYKDKNVEIKLKEDMDIQDIPSVAIACIESWLIWMKTYCRLAKDPKKLWKRCKKDIQKSIDEMEDIILNLR